MENIWKKIMEAYPVIFGRKKRTSFLILSLAGRLEMSSLIIDYCRVVEKIVVKQEIWNYGNRANHYGELEEK
jgi:hypothetical protein